MHTAVCVCVCVGRCEYKGALMGSNAGITSIEFDSTVSKSSHTVCGIIHTLLLLLLRTTSVLFPDLNPLDPNLINNVCVYKCIYI